MFVIILITKKMRKKLLFILIATVYALPGIAQKQQAIKPGEIWPDNEGKHIQAHGGGIIKLKDTWYWYGEERR